MPAASLGALSTPGPALDPCRRRRRIFVLVALAAVVAVTMVAVTTGLPVTGWTRRGIELLQRMHPVAFFGGMALLPAVGAPLLPFALAAGPAFAPRLGTLPVILLAVGAVAVNTAVSFCFARLLKQPTERGLRWLGYTLPPIAVEHPWRATLATRLAPGLPFWVQSYVLGVAGVPWWPYIVVSTVVPSVYLTGAIVAGEAAWKGGVGAALFGVSLVVFAGVFTHLWRRTRRAPGPEAKGL